MPHRLLAMLLLLGLTFPYPARAAVHEPAPTQSTPLNTYSSPVSAEIATVLASAVQVATGGEHTCALTSDGSVKCWGYNGFGQLGDGTTIDRSAPVTVGGLNGSVAAVVAGVAHTCALLDAGGVWCWGYNGFGQLGDGTTDDRSTPRAVKGLAWITALAAGGAHTCAVTSLGGVDCWGKNDFGQLGDGTNTARGLPVHVTGLSSGASVVAAGGEHTCAITSGGGIECWGANYSGQLGDGTREDRASAGAVNGLNSGVSAVTAGKDHSCAIAGDGAVKCWGWNYYGQLGDESNLDRSEPVNVSGLSNGVAAIAGGDHHTCATMSNGAVNCWGYNAYGQLGNGGLTNQWTPVAVYGLTVSFPSLAAGGAHTCTVTTSAGVKCWGQNATGQLGDGTTANHTMPTDVTGVTSGASAIAVGGDHTCAVTVGGVLQCWGANLDGQLGNGSIAARGEPVPVTGLGSGVLQATAAGSHTCAVMSGGAVKCWGSNLFGKLGDGTFTDSSIPVSVSGLSSGLRDLDAGEYHTCAVTGQGAAKCWGSNDSGQVGAGEELSYTTPAGVTELGSGVIGITAGALHSCALTTANRVKCWGDNNSGQLGDGTTAGAGAPVDVSGLRSGAVAVTAGYAHTCAITNGSGGGVQCWGYNIYGQLGDGTYDPSSLPVDVSGLSSGVNAVAAGWNHTCALVGGGVKCWGDNRSGQLGNGTTDSSATPVSVSGLETGVVAISAGASHTCALMNNGGVKCWGSNVSGQVGVNPGWVPVDALGFGGGSPKRGIAAVADTYVFSVQPDTNFGAAESLRLQYGGDSSESRVLARFDLSWLSGPNLVIDSATLHLYQSQPSDAPSTGAACLVTKPWLEGAVTWNSKPDLSGVAPVSVPLDPAPGWKSWDITTWAQDWLAHPPANQGVEIMREGSIGFLRYFDSRETTNQPRLAIKYHDASTPTPTPLVAPTQTATRTPTRTATPTRSRTVTPTRTRTPTRTATPTSTQTATRTPAGTGSPPTRPADWLYLPMIAVGTKR